MIDENYGPFKKTYGELENEEEERIKNASDRCFFGVSYLDDAMGGIIKNDLIVLAGRSGQGKSELAIHIALQNARNKKRVMYLALEAEPKEISRRLFFKALAREYYKAPPAQTLSDERPSYLRWYIGEQQDLLKNYTKKAAEELKGLDTLRIFYRGKDFGMAEINMVFASAKNETDLLILDHLHYLDLEDENENKAYKNAVKEIRDLALLHGIPVILVAHVRKIDRRATSPIPDVDDIMGSSDIFKIATKVLMIAPVAERNDAAPHKLPTYLKIGKCRLDGSLAKYTGFINFDISTATYDDKYVIGFHNFKGEWEEIKTVPGWARGAKNAII
jgi:replicative DNA helicase